MDLTSPSTILARAAGRVQRGHPEQLVRRRGVAKSWNGRSGGPWFAKRMHVPLSGTRFVSHVKAVEA
jgi:hypothetical protein